ncbi:MAG: insulinase family protein [bacterium]|nr:insulinase family protein [bacterium]
MVTINTWFAVGSKDESPRALGFAHLFEASDVSLGTERVPDNQFDMPPWSAAARNNASTSNDRTNYYSWGPRSLLPTLLWLDADRLEGLSVAMTQEQLDLQRNVVRNDAARAARTAIRRCRTDGLVRDVAPGPSYHHPVIGSHEDLEPPPWRT